MKIVVEKSPKSNKKFRVFFEDGDFVDFGARGYSDFTIHKDPLRMRRYVDRHGGIISQGILNEKNPEKVLKLMRKVRRSHKENWGLSGIKSAGFWSRWLLWSEKTPQKAGKLIEELFGVRTTLKGF